MEHAPFALVLKHVRTHAHISTRGLTSTSSGSTELLRAQNVPKLAGPNGAVRSDLLKSKTYQKIFF